MQVLENAVKKLKMPSHVEPVSTRIEPRFETAAPGAVEARTEPMPEPTSDPVQISSVRAVPAPPPTSKPRGPLFSDLPEPEFEDAAPMITDTGGSGGGGGGSAKTRDEDRKFGPWLTVLGAAASLALVVGVSVWTFKLGQRDAREVPIVAALEGPARVAPDDAGGMQVAHQGHSVNTVLEGRGVEQVASSVTIAPRDNDLTLEDAPASELTALLASRTPRARPEATPTPGEEIAALDQAKEPLMPNGSVVTSQAEPVEALPPQTEVATAQTPTPEAVLDPIMTPSDETAAVMPELEAIAPPVDLTETGETGAAELSIQPENLEVAALGPLPPVGEGSIYAPAVMKTPRARPADLNVAMSNAVNAALQAVLAESTTAPDIVAPEPAQAPVQVADASLEVIPLPNGTRMIQIGAYGSEAVARQQWDRLSGQHDDLLGSKEHYVQRTNNSGKVFYRLRVAGYQSKGETQEACAALSARGLPCITVTLR